MIRKIYDHKKIEESVILRWEKSDIFSAKIDKHKRPFSLFLNPPNASGPLHIGNALIVAIQDILTRYHRANGELTLWIPCTDHGGYETQVSFEREAEKADSVMLPYVGTGKELFREIERFSEKNNCIIKNQLRSLGASVDWSRFRSTMDSESLSFVEHMFKTMIRDGLIYRRLNMVSYCPSCATFLADIELKKTEIKTPLYYIKFGIQNEEGYITLATTRPEFLFSVTHVLVHPDDKVNADSIGKTLRNPVTGHSVEVIASRRKWKPETTRKFLAPFSPSFEKYDYGYALRYSLPCRNLVDWKGNMIEQYPGLTPQEARSRAVAFLEERGSIEKAEDDHVDTLLWCKKGHATENLIVFTWFLSLDDEKNPLRKPALQEIEKARLAVIPHWRKKGLIEWMEKMHDWPIARQNIWGIKIPVWYDVSESGKYMVWFTNKQGDRLYGSLKEFLEKGVSLEEISAGLERIYAGEGAKWALTKEPRTPYLPETDTFDTWFSSGQWAAIVFGNPNSTDFSYFYPSDSIVTGYDLLMLSVSREIMLSFYITKRLPYRLVYLHPLLRGKDGQKMSKSVGNVEPLEYYLEKFGSDATRMALVSYLSSQEDFYFSEERLEDFKDFAQRLWQMGQLIDWIRNQDLGPFTMNISSQKDEEILQAMDDVTSVVGFHIRKYAFPSAQEKACDLLSLLEKYAASMQSRGDLENSLRLVQDVYEKYLITLHPFMPFATEEIYGSFHKGLLLAAARWPGFYFQKRFFVKK